MKVAVGFGLWLNHGFGPISVQPAAATRRWHCSRALVRGPGACIQLSRQLLACLAASAIGVVRAGFSSLQQRRSAPGRCKTILLVAEHANPVQQQGGAERRCWPGSSGSWQRRRRRRDPWRPTVQLRVTAVAGESTRSRGGGIFLPGKRPRRGGRPAADQQRQGNSGGSRFLTSPAAQKTVRYLHAATLHMHTSP